MNYEQALAKLKQISQQHLLKFWDKLTSSEQSKLILEIEKLDLLIFQKQKQLLSEPIHAVVDNLKPFADYSEAGNHPQDLVGGKKLISQGKVGCLIVAGGQGTRLNFEGPKGMFPISVIKNKTLFQLLAEKVVAAGKAVGYELPLAIMTSPINHAETLEFFKKNNNFGLNPNQLSFFTQGLLPFLNEQGNLFLETPSQIAEGPNGNGTSLYHFVEQGIWQKWQDQGVRYINFIFIDNPLADPFDAELVGYHKRQNVDVTVKCTWRRDAKEKVGVLVKDKEKTAVVEYTELAESERFAVVENGILKHPCANISLFCFSMDFVFRLFSEGLFNQMPLHRAFKVAKYLSEDEIEKKSEKPIAWKYERYIFDVLACTDRVATLLYPREQCFAPLKNASGEDSVESVKLALLNADREAFAIISNTQVPEKAFELSQEFHYPTAALVKRWKDKSLPPQSYVVDAEID
jgi:UDP-N-acetylglucosamine/UDP-N-acetylgalactosamine diphosphorylase